MPPPRPSGPRHSHRAASEGKIFGNFDFEIHARKWLREIRSEYLTEKRQNLNRARGPLPLRRVRGEQRDVILLRPEGRHPHPREGVPQLRPSHCVGRVAFLLSNNGRMPVVPSPRQQDHAVGPQAIKSLPSC